MIKQCHESCLWLIAGIVDEGKGSRFLKAAGKAGCPGGTILLARGSARRSWIDLIGLGDSRKEVVLLIVDGEDADKIVGNLDSVCHFGRPGGGIAFIMRLAAETGQLSFAGCEDKGLRGGARGMYRLITTIVEKGLAEEVMDAAVSAGAKGGTIINARGTGTCETVKLFHTMEIEPEKELVMILVLSEVAQKVASAIREKMEIDKPGKGIVFIQEVEAAFGIAI